MSAVRYPAEVALVDEHGSLTFGDVHRRTNAIANAWEGDGLAAGDLVAILCRNHSGLVEATVACSKLGAHVLFLNTSFAAPEIAAVCAREAPRAIVYDDEFAAIVDEAAAGHRALSRVVRRAPAGGVPRLGDLADGDPGGARAARRARAHRDPHERDDRRAARARCAASPPRWTRRRRCCR